MAKRLGRPPKHFAWVALRTPKKLDENLKDLPEPVRDVAKKRHLLIAGLQQELGGAGRITVSEALLIDRVSRLWAYVELVDRACLDSAKPRERPTDYLGLVNSLVRATKTLSEMARGKISGGGEILDLRQYLTERASNSSSSDENTDQPSAIPPEGRTKVPENDADSGVNVREVSVPESKAE
jgi:hypothetical protein